jgi:hypothetical protein
MANNVTFKWSNYTKPTPANLKRFMEFWKGLVVLFTGNAIYNEADKWVSISILVLGYLIDRAIKFFAYVEEAEAKSSVTVEFPTEMKDQVTVTENEKS